MPKDELSHAAKWGGLNELLAIIGESHVEGDAGQPPLT